MKNKFIFSLLVLSLVGSLKADFEPGTQTVLVSAGVKSSFLAGLASNPVTIGLAATAFVGIVTYELFGAEIVSFFGKKAKSRDDDENINSGGSYNNSPDPEDKERKKKRQKPSLKELMRIANNLGFHLTKEINKMGERFFRRGQEYLTYDKTSHNGGFWKWYNGDKRLGTFDETLKSKIKE